MIRLICLIFVIAGLIALMPIAMKAHFVQKEERIADELMKDQIEQAKRTIESLKKEGKLEEASKSDDSK
jgi:mannose/fructose-specific phosphotransferase system component IIA